MLLHLQIIFLIPLFLLHIVNIAAKFLLIAILLGIEIHLHLLLNCTILSLPEGLFLLLLALTISPILLCLHISLAGMQYVVSSLLCLIKLFPRLQMYNFGDLTLPLTFYSSCLSKAIRLDKSLWSSSARFLAIFAAMSLRCRVSSSSSSYTFKSIISCWGI